MEGLKLLLSSIPMHPELFTRAIPHSTGAHTTMAGCVLVAFLLAVGAAAVLCFGRSIKGWLPGNRKVVSKVCAVGTSARTALDEHHSKKGESLEFVEAASAQRAGDQTAPS